jgi:hypothetical protein
MRDANGSYGLEMDSRPGTNLSFFHSVHNGTGAYEACIEWVSGVKGPRRGANHSPPSRNEVQNGDLYLNSPYAIMARFLTN